METNLETKIEAWKKAWDNFNVELYLKYLEARKNRK